MPITLDGTTGITTPGLTNTGTETIVNLTTTGNTILGDASTDTLNVGNGSIVTDGAGNTGFNGTATNYGATYRGIWLNAPAVPIMDFAVNGTRTLSVLATSTTPTIKTVTSSPLILGTNDTERMRLLAAGGVQHATTISVGDATPSASGAGITFPATQSASTDANTLDDYEEGTWTPNIGGSSQGGSGGAGNVYSVRVGTYLKVGKIVTCTLYVGLSTNSGNTGSVIWLNGWPFVPDATANAGLYTSVSWSNLASGYVNVMGYFNPNQANLHLIGNTAASTLQSFINPSQLTNTSAFGCTFTYITT